MKRYLTGQLSAGQHGGEYRSAAAKMLLAMVCSVLALDGVRGQVETKAPGDSPARAAEVEASAASPREPASQVVVLASGHRMEGVVVKRTDQAVFLDIGFTILQLPLGEIRDIEATGPTRAPESAERAKDVESESIFFSAKLERGTIEQKSREVSGGVVRVLCLGKSGSGFIVNGEEGYVVTNFHVIEGEQDISVVLYVRDGAPGGSAADTPEGGDQAPPEDGAAGRTEVSRGIRKVKLEKVKIVAMNPFFDLALLKIMDSEGVHLTTCYLGDFERVNVGDPVFAIGSPLGLERTVTEGIVSNRNRALSGQLSIQSTAPIHPGNSGGPLFNDRGEVIGVTSLKIVGTDSLGFAIPVHYVKDFLRNRDAFAFDKDHPNTGVRYLAPPPKRVSAPASPGGPSEGQATPSLSGAPSGAPGSEGSERPEPRGGRL